MGFQVKILFFLGCGIFSYLVTSCQTVPAESQTASKVAGFSDRSVESLEDQLVINSKSLEALEFEMEWLDTRKQIVAAEIMLRRAIESEVKLERELSGFQSMNQNFPSAQGFISEHETIKWQSRLKVKQEETGRLKTVVRLLNRDMADLDAKLARKGFRHPLSPAKANAPVQ